MEDILKNFLKWIMQGDPKLISKNFVATLACYLYSAQLSFESLLPLLLKVIARVRPLRVYPISDPGQAGSCKTILI